MKKQYLLLVLIFLGIKLNAQNCNFTYIVTPGSTQVDFLPNSAFTPTLYHYVWNFGDGSSSTVSTPSHTYNSMLPIVACCEYYDSSNTLICTACDTILLHSTSNCSFTYQNTSGNTFVFQSQNSGNGLIMWDFGDNTTAVGDPITHTYTMTGQLTVTMFVKDTMTGTIICQSTQGIVVGGSNTCSFTAANAPLSPSTFNFAANVTPGSMVTWDFGDGSAGTGLQISHTYTAPGVYLVCITSVDFFGITCQFCLPVQAGSNSNCTFSYVPDPSNVNGFIFTATSSSPNSTIGWDFGDNNVGIGSPITHVYTQPGTYQVCMIERDTVGNIVCSSCQNVTVANTSNCTFVSTPDSLNPLTINFQVNGGLGATVTWDFGDGSTGTGINAQHTYTTPGLYQVCVVIGTPGAVTCTACSYVQVGSGPSTCAITYYPDPFNPNTYIFNVGVNSGTNNVQWTFGDGTAGTGQSVTHSYNASGTYTVCVTEWDLLQQVVCQSCTTITISGGPGNCQASFLGVANGLDAFFIDMSVTNTNPVTYAWDFGDNTTSNVQFPQHTYSVPGTYTVCLSITTTTCSDSYCNTIVVDTINQNPANGCNAFFATVQLAPYQVSIVNLSSGLNLAFDWDFGDGSPHDTNAYPSHYYTSTGSYNLCLTVSDANGCTSTYCDTLNVDTLGNIFRTSSPGFTINVLSPQQLTGVNEVKKVNSFRAFPNPVTSELHVSVLAGNVQAKEFRILSYQGSEILSGKLNGIEGKINTQSLSSGTYLLEVTLIDGFRSFQSIIKQ